MEYRDNLFQKTPFYMTYPMQNLYLTEMEYEKDMERMKELYPKEVRQLQKMVEKRCDQMEYEGSRMYDENPDRYMLEMEAKRLLEEFLRQNPQYGSLTPPSPRPEVPRPIPPRPEGPMPPGAMPRPEIPRPVPPRPEGPMPPGAMPRPEVPRPMPSMPPRPMPREDNELAVQQYGRRNENGWLESLIHILFHDEIYRRRCRHRRCSRWW